MKHARMTALPSMLVLTGILTGCGGNKAVTCDEPQLYQASNKGEPIVAPDGLDDIDTRAELAIPEPSPREPRPEGSPCLERPPTYVSPNR